MTGEECFEIGMRIKDISLASLAEAEKYFKQGANDFDHSKCMLKVAEITQDEGEKNFYYELAADYGESDAIHWIIEDFLTKKNYEEARTKFESYKEHLSPDLKIELQDKITFETLKDLIAKKNYEEARTKFESYKEHLSPDLKIELQYKITFETLKDKSDKDTISTEEMRVLANHYELGTGTEKNPQEAKKLRDRADKRDFEMLKDKLDKGTISTEEMRVLANHYESGTGTEKNLQEAKELRDRAKFRETSASAGAGDVESIFQLGRMYFHDEGTKRNLDKAQACFEKADKAGHSQAKTELAKVIATKAEEHFKRGDVEKAAELGYFPAKLELIDKIPNESGRLKKYEEFLSSLSKDNALESQRQQVASRISTLKQKMEFDNLKLKPESELTVKELRKLAEFYKDCRFAGQDNYKAKELNKLADFKENKPKADANDPTACYEVAKMYLEGRGVKKNVYSAEYYIDKYRQKMPEAYDKLYELYDLLSKVLKEMANKAHTQANNMYNMYQATFITHKHSRNQTGRKTLNDLPSIHID